jgi:hypothetical protein
MNQVYDILEEVSGETVPREYVRTLIISMGLD